MAVAFDPIPIAVATVVSFLTGWLWFSPLMFGKKFQALMQCGDNPPPPQNMMYGMVAQVLYHIVLAALLYALYPNTIVIALLALASGLGIAAGTFFQGRNTATIPYVIGNEFLSILVICGVYGVHRAMA